MKYKVIALMVLCIALVAAAGCTAGNNAQSVMTEAAHDSYGSSNIAKVASESRAGYATPVLAAPVPAATQGIAGSSGSGSPAVIDTKIIKTGYITIEVKDVPGSVDALKNLVATKGGYLSSSSISEGYNKRLSGTVVLRIPQDQFDATLTGVKAVGTVKSVSTQGEDVTEEYVDVQAQIASYQNQLAQYNEIMKKAVKVSDVIEIQQQIDSVQTNLNRLEGRLKYLNSRIDMSTITVTLQEPEPIGGESGPSFISAINEGIAGFVGSIYWMIVVILSILPFILLAAIVYGIYRWRKSKQPATAPAEPAEKK